MEKTFILLKPDALQRQLDPVIKAIFLQEGYMILEERTVRATKELILTHYDEVIQRVGDFLAERMLDAFENQLMIAIELYGPGQDTITKVRDLIGATDPAKASPDSIRGRFGKDSMAQAQAEERVVYNLIHASDSVESYEFELSLWMKKDH